MGLDVYLYKVSKISTEEKDRLEGAPINQSSGYQIFTSEDENEIVFLHPYLSQISMEGEFYDLEKLKEFYKVAIDATVIGRMYSAEQVLFEFSDGSKVTISPTDFVVSKDITTFVCKMDEICHWRGDYDVREAAHSTCAVTVENLGYYPLTKKMYDAIKQVAPEFDIEYSDNLFYHEWY